MIAPTPRSLTPLPMLTLDYSLTFCRAGPEFALHKGIMIALYRMLCRGVLECVMFNGLFIRDSM